MAQTPTPTDAPERAPRRSARLGQLSSTDLFCLILLAAVAAKLLFGSELSRPLVQAWATVFVAICVQASPFVALGIAVSTAIAVLVPASFFSKYLPQRPALAVPVAGLAGCALPGCECGSVPIAASLIRRGVAPGPAVAFLLSSPAINPVVLIATAVAFPGHPEMVLARVAASLITALGVGWLWQLTGRGMPLRNSAPHDHGGRTRLERVVRTAGHDLAQTFGLLVVGAATSATVNTVLPSAWLGRLAGGEISGVLVLALLAVILAVCSESDAFIAASLSQFSPTAKLAFMVVGPAVDLKLFALQFGTFGRWFASRFAPLTWVTAVLAASVVGTVLL